MAMLDVLYASNINPHLKKQDRHKPRSADEFMPADFDRGEAPKRQKKMSIIEQLDRYAGLRK